MCFLLCRESGPGGAVFVLVFELKDKVLFQLSNFSIGGGVTIISPTNEAEWAGIAVLRSSSPCVPAHPNSIEYIPNPFPETVRQLICSTSCSVATPFNIDYICVTVCILLFLSALSSDRLYFLYIG